MPRGISSTLEALSQNLERRPPIAERIAETIRGLIVSGDLKPGDRVVESRMARQIGVGQPTVREALVALEHQGLVVRKANQGCIVTVLTRAEISQVLRVREELERLAVDLAIEVAPDPEIRRNRLALLHSLLQDFSTIADFSEIVTETKETKI